jgi:hypothetical protein
VSYVVCERLSEQGTDCVRVKKRTACACVAVVTAHEPVPCADGIRKASLRCKLPITAGGLKLRLLQLITPNEPHVGPSPATVHLCLDDAATLFRPSVPIIPETYRGRRSTRSPCTFVYNCNTH